MVSSEKLLQATLNRLSVRLSEKLIDSINKLAEVFQATPEKVRTEWEIFQDEVFEEAERLEKESNEVKSETTKGEPKNSDLATPQEKITYIREKIEKVSNHLEGNN